jgi:hypothetical protein
VRSWQSLLACQLTSESPCSWKRNAGPNCTSTIALGFRSLHPPSPSAPAIATLQFLKSHLHYISIKFSVVSCQLSGVELGGLEDLLPSIARDLDPGSSTSSALVCKVRSLSPASSLDLEGGESSEMSRRRGQPRSSFMLALKMSTTCVYNTNF